MDQELSVGDVIGGTLATVAENKQAAIVYLVFFTVLGTAVEWGFTQIGGGTLGMEDAGWFLAAFGIGAGIGGILFLIATVVGQYLLWEAMLRQRNYLPAGYNRRFLAFFGQSILTGLGVGIGFILLIVPGLIFWARWAMAPAFLIVEKQGLIDSMGNSWDEVRGRTTPVVLALLAATILLFGLSVSVGAGMAVSAASMSGIGLVAVILSHLLSNIGTVLGVGLGTFLFGRLHGSSQELSGVFE